MSPQNNLLINQENNLWNKSIDNCKGLKERQNPQKSEDRYSGKQ